MTISNAMLTDRCDVVRFTDAATDDDFGNSEGTWDVLTQPAAVTDDAGQVRCWVDSFRNDTENRNGQEVTVRRRWLYANPAIVITDRDRIRYDGHDYFIVSVHTRNGRSGSDHKEVDMEVGA